MQDPSVLALSAADGLVLTMVALLSFSLGMVLTLLVVISKGSHRSSEEEHYVFDNLETPSQQNKNAEVGEQSSESRAPWERDPNWWRDG